MMAAPALNLDQQRQILHARTCAQPVTVRTKDAGEQYARCGSRDVTRCPNCSELYLKDWAHIARSGVFPPAPDTTSYHYYFLTLTAPSFGKVHRVPHAQYQKLGRCPCGRWHTENDAYLRGCPLDHNTYDYDGQNKWMEWASRLINRTAGRLRREMPSLEYFCVKEAQDRGVLHPHILIRCHENDAVIPVAIEMLAAQVTTQCPDGYVAAWGEQIKCDDLTGAGEREQARVVGYVCKALTYSLKDLSGDKGSPSAMHHRELVRRAHRRNCVLPIGQCLASPACQKARKKGDYGMGQKIVSMSDGWSFTGLNREKLKEERRQWRIAHPVEGEEWAERQRKLLAASAALADGQDATTVRTSADDEVISISYEEAREYWHRNAFKRQRQMFPWAKGERRTVNALPRNGPPKAPWIPSDWSLAEYLADPDEYMRRHRGPDAPDDPADLIGPSLC